MTPPNKGNILPALQHLAEPVDSFDLLEGNPRRGDMRAIRASLEEFGQVEPILWRERNGLREVVHGNHRLQVILELGWAEVAAVDCSGFSEEKVKALALAMNRTSDLGTYDTTDLLALVSEVDSVELLTAAGYDQTTLEMLELVESRQHDFDREKADKKDAREREQADTVRLTFTPDQTTMDVWRSIPWDPGLSDNERFEQMVNVYAAQVTGD